jgi:imidazolonepropionase-like amidohydrolase
MSHLFFNFTELKSNFMKLILFFIPILFTTIAFSQNEPDNGVKKSKSEYYAIKGATVYMAPGKIVKNATILIKDNKIEKIGVIVSIPSNAVTVEADGKFILPGFIDLFSNTGFENDKDKKGNSSILPERVKNGAYYWNSAIHPEYDASSYYSQDDKSSDLLIEKGFAFALTHPHDGIARGENAFVAIGKIENHHYSSWTKSSSFSFKAGSSKESYPSSQMGSIALLKQAFYDAKWYSKNGIEHIISLEALNAQTQNPMFFETDDQLEINRAKKIGDNFGFQFHYVGSGNEYQAINDFIGSKSTFVLPINFPEAYDVKNPYLAKQIPLSDLRHWEMAPRNPAILFHNNLNVCITADGCKTSKDFWNNLREAIKHGLTQDEALTSLTINPAKTLNIQDKIGSIEVGKFANIMIYDTNPFESEAKLMESWVMGEQTVYHKSALHEVAGKYNLLIDSKSIPITISGNPEKLSGKIKYALVDEKTGTSKDTTASAFVSLAGNDITIQFVINSKDFEGNISCQGKVNSKLGLFEGKALLPSGEFVNWSGIKNGDEKQDKKNLASNDRDTSMITYFPNMAYGFDTIPEQSSVLIQNATVWTNEIDGILENAFVLIVDEKIKYVGTRSPKTPNGTRVIDAKGKHVTSGIIDEHSHIAISKGVNEGGQAISAEVSIGDVVNPFDINIYRQLSGGVTAAQLLHGSANPIGGQSALIKLKWGHSADEMLIPNAPKFIKFALGENVKQSNWGSYNSVRFPQTRMGVEQVYYDAFHRAEEYDAAWAKFKSNPKSPEPRVDLELEVISEIAKSERFVTCHSYVQSEINMLMHMADSMGFRINTFTHILEGYKLADKMAKHGVGGSTFADWWAYKYEVNDAIPFNAKLMADQGVVVAINSDDAEMGRRLNQEAAKSVKYGGMSEEDAWKLVTLNPAKLLHLDDRMGSIKEGKDADIVIWTDNPLSILAKVQYTIVDGKILFDYELDEQLRIHNQKEKARIITKMMDESAKGKSTTPFIPKKKGAYHCNTLGEELSTEENHH